jgi:hypothetical protein
MEETTEEAVLAQSIARILESNTVNVVAVEKRALRLLTSVAVI